MQPLSKTSIAPVQNKAKALTVLDMGSSILLNGIQYSQDLVQTFGFKDDAGDVFVPLAANGQSSDPSNGFATGKIGYNNSSLMNDKIKTSIALTNGKILTLSCNNVGIQWPGLANAANVKLTTINPATNRVESAQDISFMANSATLFPHFAHFVDTGTVIVAFIAYDDSAASALNANNYVRCYALTINRTTGIIQSNVSLFTLSNAGYYFAAFLPFMSGADAGLIVNNGGGGLKMQVATSLGATAGAVTSGMIGPATTSTDMLQENICAGVAPNSFYSMHVGSGSDKLIVYVQAAVPATSSTAVACTVNDLTPLTDMGTTAPGQYESTKNASYEIKVINISGVNYLVVLTRITFTTAAGTIAQYGMFAYQIDATDPTKLTLTAYQKFSTPPSLACFDPSNTIWVYVNGALTTYTFAGNSFVPGASIAVASITDIIFTQQGTVLAIDKINRYAYNVTMPTALVVDCYFQEAQLQYDSAALTAHVVVNVYDGTGARQVQTVQLLLQGGTFQAGGTSVSVTTSATADTIVPVIITNPGIVAVTPALQ